VYAAFGNQIMRILPRSPSEIDEADRLLDLPHPREVLDLYGQDEAEQALLEAYKSGRMHHGWILSGQAGIGKATLAYRFARFVLTYGDCNAPEVQAAVTLDVPETSKVARLIAAQSHPDVFVLRRNWNEKTKKLRTEIQVDDTRNLVHMFQSTASAGGWRVAIIDAAEDLNANSANALLKILEEPPLHSIFFIISHEAGRLLPTIRSRCRMLPMRALEDKIIAKLVVELSDKAVDEMSLQHISGRASGSVRRAFALLDGNSLGFRGRVEVLLQKLPVIDSSALTTIAEETAKRDGITFERFVEVIEDYLYQAVHARKSQNASSLMPFAEIAEKFSTARRDVDAYNLDRRPLVLSVVGDIARAVSN
jgi:DNA polymerase III subunit delta'